MEMGSLEDLLQIQSSLADEIQNVVITFKNIPPGQQNLIQRKDSLENLWTKFHEGNTKVITTLNGDASDHAYVKQNYYIRIKSIRDECISKIDDAILAMQPKSILQMSTADTSNVERI